MICYAAKVSLPVGRSVCRSIRRTRRTTHTGQTGRHADRQTGTHTHTCTPYYLHAHTHTHTHTRTHLADHTQKSTGRPRSAASECGQEAEADGPSEQERATNMGDRARQAGRLLHNCLSLVIVTGYRETENRGVPLSSARRVLPSRNSTGLARPGFLFLYALTGLGPSVPM